MTTLNQTIEVTPISESLARVNLTATFTAQADATDWIYASGDVIAQVTGPVDAATVAIERSTVDPSGGDPNTAEVDDVTGDPLAPGVTLTILNDLPSWFRVQNKATFGPAANVVERTLDTLAAAINGLAAYPINDFAAGTDPQPLVHATTPTATTLLVTAATPGVAGNSIATAGTIANGAWGDTVLENGADAVAADGTLTFTDQPEDTETVTIGEVVYTYVTALGDGDYEVLIGADAEASRDNLLDAINAEGAPSTGILTASANPAAGGTVYIQPYTYTVVTALTGAAFEVLRGAAATDTLDNLIAAVNSAAGGGTLYGVNTPPHPLVTAAAGAGDTIDFESIGIGAEANLIKTLENSASLSWGASQLAGATGPGVTYGDDVEEHPLVTGAANSTDAIDVTANTAGAAGNDIVTTTDVVDASWGATELENGADAVAAAQTLTMTGAFANNDTFVVGAITYTAKTALTPTAGEVQIAGTKAFVTLTSTQPVNV